MKQRKIAVIGGGAAGLMAAIIAVQNDAKADIWERNDRVGKKILATGNGKCNFSNRELSLEQYFGNDLSIPGNVLNRFDTHKTEAFFQKSGMLIKAKGTLLYPYSEQAGTVLDVLRFEADNCGVKTFTNAYVTKIEPLQDGSFKVSSKDRTKIYDSVILTCGGKAAPKTGSDGNGYLLAKSLGHEITTLCPGLTGLKVKNMDFKAISGVRTNAAIQLFIQDKFVIREMGELQLTDYGVSGIVIFQLSRLAGMAIKSQKKVSVSIDICPDIDLQTLKLFLLRKKHQYEGRTLEGFLTGFINKKLGLYLCKKLNLSSSAYLREIKDEKIYELAELCKNWPIEIEQINTFDQAQVTAGGVSFHQIDENLQSKIHKGLYFAGEILDVDGKCGGYNLQWAWSSGYVAGLSAAQNK